MDVVRFILALVAICTLCYFAGVGAQTVHPYATYGLLPVAMFGGRMAGRYGASGRW